MLARYHSLLCKGGEGVYSYRVRNKMLHVSHLDFGPLSDVILPFNDSMKPGKKMHLGISEDVRISCPPTIILYLLTPKQNSAKIPHTEFQIDYQPQINSFFEPPYNNIIVAQKTHCCTTISSLNS